MNFKLFFEGHINYIAAIRYIFVIRNLSTKKGRTHSRKTLIRLKTLCYLL